MIAASVLDLSPVPEGASFGQALAASADLARHAEALGYRRFWLAEHHNMPGIASAATAVVIGHVAAATSTIRVGAGGIMLPNHAPLQVAEAFGTLDALHPGRIDLGLGRAPGTDQATAHALRRTMVGGENRFPSDVVELQRLLGWGTPEGPVRAYPGDGTRVPIWMLGSSLFGAELAAYLGLPYAFASHFAPQALAEALHVYRTHFRPSEQLDRPYAVMGTNIFAADTDEEAEVLATSMMQAFVNLRRGRPGRIPRPDANFPATLSPGERQMLDQVLSVSAIGSVRRVREQMSELVAAFQPDELIIAANIHDQDDRKKSFGLAMEALSEIKAPQ